MNQTTGAGVRATSPSRGSTASGTTTEAAYKIMGTYEHGCRTQLPANTLAEMPLVLSNDDSDDQSACDECDRQGNDEGCPCRDQTLSQSGTKPVEDRDCDHRLEGEKAGIESQF